MSSALLHSPAEVIAKLLVDLGAGSDPESTPLSSWPIYVDSEPDGSDIPDEVLTVYDTDGNDDGHGMVDGFAYTHHGLQVRIRARDHSTGAAKALEIRRLLNEAVANDFVVLPNTLYYVPAVKASPVRRLGREIGKSRRHLWTVNGLAVVIRDMLPAPAGYYKFDNDLTDSSGNARNLTGSGSETYTASVLGSGLTGGAPSRTQNLLTGSVFTGSYSVGAWFTRLASGSATVRLTNGNGTSVLSLQVLATQARVLTSNGGIIYNEDYPVGTPRHVMLTVDRGRAVVYLDGEVEATYDFTTLDDGNTFSTGGAGVLSVAYSGAGNFAVDELVLVQSGLSAGQVEALYNNGAGFPYPIG